jgi:hypothetical protein
MLAGWTELTNMIWASMHDLMIGLLYYDVEVFIFPCLSFLSIFAFRKAINIFRGGGEQMWCW